MEHFKSVTTNMGISSHLHHGNNNKKINAVLMGRATWESIPLRFRPLSGRLNVVLSRNPEFTVPEGVVLATSLQQAMQKLEDVQKDDNKDVGTIFVIGGANVYDQAIKEGYISRVIYTQVDTIPDTTKFDVFFPELLPSERWICRPFCPEDKENGNQSKIMTSEKGKEHVDEKSGLTYRFLEYIRKPEPSTTTTCFNKEATATATTSTAAAEDEHEEMQYLNLCREIITSGVKRGDRTGTGTLSRFGTQMRFSLRNGRLPLLTTKRTFWRGVAEELLWFISVSSVFSRTNDGGNKLFVQFRHSYAKRKTHLQLFCNSFMTAYLQGSTNANELAAKNIHIWDGNGSREFLDQRGLQHRQVGDLGPVYGYQWRHFGAKVRTQMVLRARVDGFLYTEYCWAGLT